MIIQNLTGLHSYTVLKSNGADALEMCAACQVGSTNSLETNSFHFLHQTLSGINVQMRLQPVNALLVCNLIQEGTC